MAPSHSALAAFIETNVMTIPVMQEAFAPTVGWMMIFPVGCSTLCWWALYKMIEKMNNGNGANDDDNGSNKHNVKTRKEHNDARHHLGPDWNIRTLTLVHGILSVLLASASIFGWGPWPFDETNLGFPNTPYQVLTLHISIGYFFFDLLWCAAYGESIAVFAHHLTTLFAAVLCLLIGSGGTSIITCIWGAEISNPMLQMRWFLREMMKRYPDHPSAARWKYWSEWNEWYFFFVFTGARIIVGPYFLWTTLKTPTVPIVVKIAGSMIQILSIMWWITIAKKVVRVLKAKKRV